MARKPSKTNTKRNLPLRYSYWEDWALIDCKTGVCKFRISKSNEAKISNLRKEVIEEHVIEKIPDLIRADPNSIRTSLVSNMISRYQQLSRTDTTAKKIYDKIEKALHGDLRGRTNLDKVITMAELELGDFKEMVQDRLKGKRVSDIIRSRDTHDVEGTMNRIWNSYIKISRIILNSVGKNEKNKDDWQFVYLILDKMRRNIKKPAAMIYFPTTGKDKLKWLLIKGTRW